MIDVKDIESVYFEIIKKQSIIAARQATLDRIFAEARIERL